MPARLRGVKAAVGIPVWANGDVTSAQGALALLAATGCDGVAVGRGAMGNPWLFGQIAAALAGQAVPPAPPLAQRLAVMRRHVYELCEDKGEYIGMREARSHAAWYLHGLRGAAALRRMCCGMEHFEDLDTVIARVWEYQREEAGRTRNGPKKAWRNPYMAREKQRTEWPFGNSVPGFSVFLSQAALRAARKRGAALIRGSARPVSRHSRAAYAPENILPPGTAWRAARPSAGPWRR